MLDYFSQNFPSHLFLMGNFSGSVIFILKRFNHHHLKDLLLVFRFLSNQEKMVHHDSDLFSGIAAPKITYSYWFVITFFYLKSVLISLIIPSLIASFSVFGLKRFLIFFIISYSDCFCVFSFLGFFLPPCTFLTHVGLL